MAQSSESENEATTYSLSWWRRSRPLALLLAAASSTARVIGAQEQEDGSHRRHREEQASSMNRRLEQQNHKTLAKWRSLQDSGFDLTKLRPLDLVLDESDKTHQRVYQKGAGGFLEPYDFENYQDGFVGTLDLRDLIDKNDGIVRGTGDINVNGPAFKHKHHRKRRLGHTSTSNFDPFDRRDSEDEVTTTAERRHSFRGFTASLEEDQDQHKPSTASFFRYTEANDPEELEEYGVIDEKDFAGIGTRGRQLKESYKDNGSTSTFQDGSYDTNQENIETLAKTDTTPSIVKATFPPEDTSIGSHQTFGAIVNQDFGVKNICLQFKAPHGKRSSCFRLENVSAKDHGGRRLSKNHKKKGTTSDMIWELSFESFHLFAGQQWHYRIKSTDYAKKRARLGGSSRLMN